MRHSRLWALALVAVATAGCGKGAAKTPTPIVPFSSATATPAPTTPQPSWPPGVVGSPLSLNAPARILPAAGFDPVTKHLILFGGKVSDTSPPRNDTWSWNGKEWSKVGTAHTPPALVGASMVVDPISGKLLMLGGTGAVDAAGKPVPEGMWRWLGDDWEKAGENPVQSRLNVAADAPHKQIVANAPGGSFVWNGTSWAAAAANLTGTLRSMNISGAAVAAESGGRRIIEFGGTGSTTYSDTVAWDGGSWSTARTSPPVTPTPRGVVTPTPPGLSTEPPPGEARAVFDGWRNQILLVGGYIEDRDTPSTWVWNGARWNRLRVNEPPLLIGAVMVYDPEVAGVVILGGQVIHNGGVPSDPLSAVYLWRGAGWSLVPSRTAS